MRSSHLLWFSPISRQISLYTFGTMEIEFTCLEEYSRSSDRILNESRSFGRQELIFDVSEISKHSTETLHMDIMWVWNLANLWLPYEYNHDNGPKKHFSTVFWWVWGSVKSFRSAWNTTCSRLASSRHAEFPLTMIFSYFSTNITLHVRHDGDWVYMSRRVFKVIRSYIKWIKIVWKARADLWC